MVKVKPKTKIKNMPNPATRRHVRWIPNERQGMADCVPLSQELKYFAEYVQLDEMEQLARQSLLLDLRDSVLQQFPSADINFFGSFPVGMSTFLSDIDVSINESNTGGHRDSSAVGHASSRKRAASPPPVESEASKRSRPDPTPSTSVDVSALRERVALKLAQKRALSEDTSVEVNTHAAGVASADVLDWAIDNAPAQHSTSARSNVDVDLQREDDDLSDGTQSDCEADDYHSDQEEGPAVGVDDGEAPAYVFTRKEKIFILQKVYNLLKSAAWMERIEFRKHARVPILNLTHKNGVECDVSLDMSQQATSLVVRTLMQRSGPALATLSAFLKIYLSQLGLDAPFTGGLGSYKLYVLLAKHIERHQQSDANPPEAGPLLLSFLKHYGDPRNLSRSAVIRMDGLEDTEFARVAKVTQICAAFEKAHSVLMKIHLKSKLYKHDPTIVEDCAGDAGMLYSSSALAALLNTKYLCLQRMQRRALCHSIPPHRKTRQETRNEAHAKPLVRNKGIDMMGDGTCDKQLAADGDCAPVVADDVDFSGDLSDSDASTAGEVVQFSAHVPVDPRFSVARIQAATDKSMSKAQRAEARSKVVFKPKSAIGQAIIAGTMELPADMLVQVMNMIHLPYHYRTQMWPFRTLRESQHYNSLSYEELARQRDAKQRDRVQNQDLFDTMGWAGFGYTREGGVKVVHELFASNMLDLPAKGYKIPKEAVRGRREALKYQKTLDLYFQKRTQEERKQW